MTYDEALSYLESLGAFGIKPGLQRIELLLKKLGQPQKKTQFVHVTGTNGKGSVTSMLTNIFKSAKLKTGNFTSPHLVKWNERININGVSVSDEQLAEAIEKVKVAADEVGTLLEPPTQFEIITAVAFYLFAQAKLDIVVLEVGMGGLLDSTNVIEPLCSVITNVSLDHTDKLGDSLQELAEQKAGIIKTNIPVVTATEGEVLTVVQTEAVKKNAKVYLLGKDFSVTIQESSFAQQQFTFNYGQNSYSYMISLAGKHQVDNAALAVMTALLVSEKYSSITQQTIKEGLSQTRWAGRLEQIEDKPIVIVDGAHNLASAKVLRKAIDDYFSSQKICFVLGIMKDKDIKGIVDVLVQKQDILLATRADDSTRAAQPEDIVKHTSAQSFTFADVEKAIDKAKELALKDGVVIIAGSLYLVGQVKALQNG